LRRLKYRVRETTRPATRRALGVAFLVTGWAVVALVAGLSVASFLIGLGGAVVGGLIAGLSGGGGNAGRRGGADRVDPAPATPTAAETPAAESPAADPVPPILAALRGLLSARRLVLWRVDRDIAAVVATDSTGAMPTPRPLPGEPIGWCAEEGQLLRIDPPPGWADARVLAVPVPTTAGSVVLTLEAGPSHVPERDAVHAQHGDDLEPATALMAARILASVLDLRRSDRQRLADLNHVRRILDFLRDPPGADDPSILPAALARTAAEAAGSTGALVARWDADDDDAGGHETRSGSGVVVARFGRGKGPEPGMEIAPGASDLAIAVRAGMTLQRDARTSTRPLVGPGERWSGRPRYTTIIPLLDSSGRCGAVLALWGDEPVEPSVVALLEALGPVLVLQLGHSLDLVRIRDRVDRDALTGLANRTVFDERLQLEARRFHRYRRPIALLVLDLDHFKAVNDAYGHPAGDAVLKRVADLLRASTRDADVPARYGGEEMVVVLPETMLRQAVDVAERIRSAVDATAFEHEGQPIDLTVSIGVSACPECVGDPAELLRTADDALYDAKRGGRNRVATAPLVAVGG
jgi:diguanylate cyclase (GGDEF)-like protein